MSQQERIAEVSKGATPNVKRRTTKRVQPKLKLGAPNDAFEREADRVAEQVMRMPDPLLTTAGTGAARVQRKCAACAAAEAVGRPAPCPSCAAKDAENTVRRKTNGAGASVLGAATASKIEGLRGGGAPLPARERAYFEPRFGRSFDAVRIHTGHEAVAASQAIQAKALTYGRDIAFSHGQYAPGSTEGRRLLAHELTHVVQQGASLRVGGGAEPVRRETVPMVQGDWIIDNHARRATAGGSTDGQLVEDAFQQICPRTMRSGDRLSLNWVALTPANRMEGCGCLGDIEADLASSSPVLDGTPHIGLTVDGWSSSSPTASPPIVNARHPQGSFEWGYWTGGQARELKPLFRTVAHEICGHVVTLVRTGGVHAGGRRSPTGHNEAIEGENRVAGEHGVPASRQRGLDRDPTGAPLSGHRGESFLQADVAGFAHGGSGTVSTNVASVVTGAVNTIATVQTNNRVSLMVQVEGFALSNEGRSVAHQRAAAVHTALDTAIRARSGLTVPAAGRFQPHLDTVLPGRSTPGTSNGGRRVQVYLFHKLHSAGP